MSISKDYSRGYSGDYSKNYSKNYSKYYGLPLLLAVAVIASCDRIEDSPTTAPEVQSVASKATYDATIRWTNYGIPHIKADNWGSLGYGFGYALAEDAICVIAEVIVTVNGERSKYFGGQERDLTSDIFHKSLLDQATIAAAERDQRLEMTDLSNGYVAGYNRYLQDNATTLPASCRGKPWLRPITQTDMTKVNIGSGIRYGLGRVMAQIANATPPGESDGTDSAAVIPDPSLRSDPALFGSNAYAIGKALTANGRGILLGNPHYPWQGPSRFHMAHLTIPDEIDVMGVGLYTTVAIAIGFNQHIAWTHTVSTALRFTVYELSLVEGNPLAYHYGDEVRNLEKRQVSIAVTAADGKTTSRDHVIYMSHYGPVMVSRDTPWTRRYAYAMRDVNLGNSRGGDQYYRIARAKSVEEIRVALAQVQGVAFVNTIAADVNGTAFYADMSAIPNVDSDLIDDCKSPNVSSIFGNEIIVLNGSDPRCEWQTDAAAAAAGLMPATQLPHLSTDQYVTNSNDSYWLSNPAQRLEGFSPIIGDEGTPRSLRTRAGIVFIEEVLARKDGKFTAETVQNIMYNHRNYGAEILLDDVLAICTDDAPSTDVSEACRVLAAWDRRQDLTSRGAQIYTEFWRRANRIVGLYAIPFDREDPVHTPRGIDTRSQPVRKQVMAALADAVTALNEAGIPLDAQWQDVQFVERNGKKIGIPGGSGGSGMFSSISARLQKGAGYTPVVSGNSYIQVVTWDDDGNPDARAVLTYAQSQEPESPHYADQTQLYSEGGWIELPFTEAEILRDQIKELRLVSAE